MDQDDPEKRITELERQLAEQKRIAELERQLAEAKAAAAHVRVPQSATPPLPGPPPPPSAPQSGPAMGWKGAWVSVDGGGFQQVGPPGAGATPPPQAMERVAEIMRLAGLGGQGGLGGQARFPAAPADTRLAEPPRRIPAAFYLAELLPFRWWYLFALFMVGVAPIALWMFVPLTFSVVAVLTLFGIYAFSFRGTAKRFALLKRGQVATVTNTQIISRGTYYSGTTYSNMRLPVAHGWTVRRPWYSGPSTKTQIRYTLNGSPGELVVKGREYIDGVVLADSRNPARALCVTSFPYDLDRDESGNWIGRLRRGLQAGMAVWLIILIGWLAASAVVGFAAAGVGFGAYLFHTAVPPGGELTVDEMDTTKTIACNDGHLTVDSQSTTVTVTGHCVQLTVSGISNHVTVNGADTIDAAGIDNVVIFHSGSPQITNNGIDNTVQRG
jgi:hypothetical protein